MSTLYEIVELANGDIALQKEGDAKNNSNRAPLVTMRFSTDLLRFLRSAKMDIAKVMIEAGLERVAKLAESVSREDLESKIDKHATFEFDRRGQRPTVGRAVSNRSGSDQSPAGIATKPRRSNPDITNQDITNQKNTNQDRNKHRVANRLSGRDNSVELEEQHPTVSHLLH